MISTMSDDSMTLHYQPLTDVQGKVVSFESLMRWHHQRRGPISPEAFIPIFENSRLIVPLSRWALRQACLDAVRWKRPLQVSVNLSPFQFIEDDLPELVATVLNETGLAPERLELEITETALAADSARALTALSKLTAQGVRIALDDAGSLFLPVLLQNYPFSKIKIARDVVSNIEASPSARSIVHMIMLVARSLHVVIAAKGVETGEQLAYLREQGCDLIQGYLVGRPAPIEAFAAVTGNTSADFAPSATSIPRHVEAFMAHADESESRAQG